MQLLFDFIRRPRGRGPDREPAAKPRPEVRSKPAPVVASEPKPRIAPPPSAPRNRKNNNGANGRISMQDRYDAIVREMKATYGLRVKKWRQSTTGCAWIVYYHDGSVSRLIESPYPKGPMSLAIFLHEVGHHAIGFGRYKPRCLEEYHAWKWSLDLMRARGFNVTPAVEKRMREALEYAVAKARRRGLKSLPLELEPFIRQKSRPLRVSG